MTEPTNEFNRLYDEHGQKPKGSGEYLDAWYWYSQGRQGNNGFPYCDPDRDGL